MMVLRMVPKLPLKVQPPADGPKPQGVSLGDVVLLISGSQETSSRADFEGQVGARWSLVTPDMS